MDHEQDHPDEEQDPGDLRSDGGNPASPRAPASSPTIRKTSVECSTAHVPNGLRQFFFVSSFTASSIRDPAFSAGRFPVSRALSTLSLAFCDRTPRFPEGYPSPAHRSAPRGPQLARRRGDALS